MTTVKIDTSWKAILQEEFDKPYFIQIKQFVVEEREKGKTTFPPGDLIFNAFNLSQFQDTKVVIIGQDPYHGEGQAHGLSFSVLEGMKTPPSLKNIYKELVTDIEEFTTPTHGNLESWAKQGVLLLNAILTVNAKEPASHRKAGWEYFTDAVIEKISQEKENVVFLLWGKFAQQKAKLIDEKKHLILQAAHPSPFSAYNGFFGCQHFSKCNAYLRENGLDEIDWRI